MTEDDGHRDHAGSDHARGGPGAGGGASEDRRAASTSQDPSHRAVPRQDSSRQDPSHQDRSHQGPSHQDHSAFARPSEHTVPRPAGHDTEPVEDTVELGRPPAPSYPPPSLPSGPPVPPPQQPGGDAGWWAAPSGDQPAGPGPYPAPYGHPRAPLGQGPAPLGPPVPQHPAGVPPAHFPHQQPHVQPGGAPGRFPAWAWPVITAIALVTGLLGGVLGGLAVASSWTAGSSAPISADNGAAEPLAADNGSIAAVAARVLPSTVQIQANGGSDGTAGGATGSGFVLDDQQHVITNNHVVAGATGAGELKVVDRNGKRHAARIVGRSPVYDLAVLAVDDGAGLRPAAIGSARGLRVGDTVVAIGSPLGLSSTVTSGIVSATDRPVTTGDEDQSSFINALQTDAAINPGNSGGPLVDMRGRVVGVNSAIATTGGSLSGQSGNIGVGFAIPMEQVRITAGQILDTGKARYPVIGASVDTSPGNTGAEVVAVPAGTPAADAGLREGDVVTVVDGTPVTDGIGLIVAIRSHRPGETIDLRVRRGSTTRDVRVRLDSKVG